MAEMAGKDSVMRLDSPRPLVGLILLGCLLFSPTLIAGQYEPSPRSPIDVLQSLLGDLQAMVTEAASLMAGNPADEGEIPPLTYSESPESDGDEPLPGFGPGTEPVGQAEYGPGTEPVGQPEYGPGIEPVG
jgi:hypothetical protein